MNVALVPAPAPAETHDLRDAWLEMKLAETAQRRAAMREEAERIIAESRASIRPRLRQVLDDCQADYLQGDYEPIGSRQSHEWGD